jgi:molecular chaperone DnaJ
MVDAALGVKTEVVTIHGTKKLTIPEGTQSGAVFTLRGQGVKNLRGRGHGDMFVEIHVQTPTKLCEEQIKLLREFDSLCDKHGQKKEHEGFFSRLVNEVMGKTG